MNNRFTDSLEKCFKDGHIDMRDLLECFSVNFDNISISDVRFIESQCRDVRQRFEDADKVDCYKVTGYTGIGLNVVYYSINEVEEMKAMIISQLNKNVFDTQVSKIKISESILIGHIRDRKEWEST